MDDERYGPTSLRARFFDPIEIVFRGRRIDVTMSSHALALLAYLLTRDDRTIRREEIALRLWPDVPTVVSKAMLRRQFHRLKTLCGGELPFRCDARSVCFDDPWGASSDVGDFDALAARGELESALALYGGTFLPFLDHEWVAAKRESLHLTYCTVLRRVAYARYEAGDLCGTLALLERLHVQEPWHEDVVRALSTLRCAVGDRAGGFATYARFRARLRSELAIEPARSTTEHFDALAHGESPEPFDRALRFARS